MKTTTIYEPLDPTRHEIRLLQILPEVLSYQGADEIFCTIKRISLEDAAEGYEALSYAWGIEVSSKKIHIRLDDIEVAMTPQENLYQALLHLRHLYRGRDEPFVIWADAICINQSDNTEKTNQVQQMKKVYENASIVTVWLGVAAGGSDQFLETLRPVANTKIDNDFAQIVTGVVEEADISLAAMEAFLIRPWWLRVWVVQEIASATVVQFYCGYCRVSEDEMSTMFHVFSIMKNVSSAKVASSRSDFERRVAAVQHFGPQRSIFLELPTQRRRRYADLKLMDRFLKLYMVEPSSEMAMKASDPRDLIFSLLGISYDAEVMSLKADYSKSVAEVFIETAAAFLSIGDLRVLELAQNPDSMTTMPSWVPDWASPITFTLPSVRWQTDHGTLDDPFRTDESVAISDTRQYKASKGLQSPGHIVQTSTVGLSLLISAIEIDYVSDVFGSGSHLTIGAESLFLFWDRIYMAARRLPGGTTPYHDVDESVFRLLTLDRERLDRSGNWAVSRSRKEFWSSACQAYKLWTDIHFRKAPSEFWDNLTNNADLKRFAIDSSIVTAGKHAFVTGSGLIGMGPQHMLAGDLVTIIAGASVPFILRRDNHGTHRLVGEAYVQGFMDGEAVNMGLPIVNIDLY